MMTSKTTRRRTLRKAAQAVVDAGLYFSDKGFGPMASSARALEAHFKAMERLRKALADPKSDLPPGVTYDAETGALYVYVSKDSVHRTTEMPSADNAIVNADYDKDGCVVGIEFILDPKPDQL